MDKKNPVEIQLEIENKCSLSCLHCSSHNNLSNARRGYKYNDVIDILRRIQAPVMLNLTGGEPLANTQIKMIVSRFKNANANESVQVGIFTSGLISYWKNYVGISKDYALMLHDAGLSNCSLSLYHSESKLHDLVVGKIGCYESTLYSINNLIAAGITVKIHLVVNKLNINDLASVVVAFDKLNISELRLLKLVKTGRALGNWDVIGVSDEEQELAIKNIFEANQLRTKLTVSGIPEMVPCRPFDNSVGCQAGANLLYITFSGAIFPCACTRNTPECKICDITEPEILVEHFNRLSTQCYDYCLTKQKDKPDPGTDEKNGTDLFFRPHPQ